jgi:hypothetical protein
MAGSATGAGAAAAAAACRIIHARTAGRTASLECRHYTAAFFTAFGTRRNRVFVNFTQLLETIPTFTEKFINRHLLFSSFLSKIYPIFIL